jgi:hypothetical protein
LKKHQKIRSPKSEASSMLEIAKRPTRLDVFTADRKFYRENSLSLGGYRGSTAGDLRCYRLTQLSRIVFTGNRETN